MTRRNLHPLPLITPHGIFTGCFTPRGLARLHWPGTEAPCSRKTVCSAPPACEHDRRAVERFLTQYLSGAKVMPSASLDLSTGTAFQQAVWEVLAEVPWGGTTTYGELARAIGRPGAARAVGAACGANPVPLVVPCHRVLCADGRLGGWSGPAGWKPRLLKMERVALRGPF
jgi:methylated-DNA-[protein]-cysteine S-methyltransferase